MGTDQYIIRDQNAVYFVTFTVERWIDVFTRAEHRVIITDSLNYCIANKGLIVYSWCLMSNHLHLIVQAESGHRMSDIIRDLKKFTAKAIIHQINTEPESRRVWMINEFQFRARPYSNRDKHKFWQDTNHAIELGNNKIFAQKMDYIHGNPVKARIVDEQEHYIYSSARDYCGRKGLVNITLADDL